MGRIWEKDGKIGVVTQVGSTGESVSQHPKGPEVVEEQDLRALEERYRGERMEEEERLELRDQIRRLRCKEETNAEMANTQRSGLGRTGDLYGRPTLAVARRTVKMVAGYTARRAWRR